MKDYLDLRIRKVLLFNRGISFYGLRKILCENSLDIGKGVLLRRLKKMCKP